MQDLCPKCKSLMQCLSTASIPPIVRFECFNCGYVSKPVKEIEYAMELPIEWQCEGKREGVNELKPCPFCGTPYPYITFERGYLDDSAVVFCNACKISVKLEENDQEGFNDATKRKAIDAWNRREGEKE